MTRTTEGKALHRAGIAGIVLGAAVLIACGLPVVLALIGLWGLGAGASAFQPNAQAEIVGIVLAVIGVGLLIALPMRRRRKGNAKEGLRS